MAHELRDLVDEVETIARTARGALVGATGDKATVAELRKGIDEATGDLDDLLARLDRARVDGVIPR